MPQLFSRADDRRFRRIALIAVFAVVLVLAVLIIRPNLGSAWGVGKTVPQPIPFSHAQHVGKLGLDCATCHDGAASGANAGMPSTETCLGCHAELFRGTRALQPLHDAAADGQQIRWNRVTGLPDIAHFHHGAHIRAEIDCATCHGDVATMDKTHKTETLNMGFCVDCHRKVQDPARESAVRPVSEWHRDLTDCSVCHY